MASGLYRPAAQPSSRLITSLHQRSATATTSSSGTKAERIAQPALETRTTGAWGAPVLAPASGTVVAVVDGISDNTPGGTNTEAHPAGNHVVLRTGSDEFLFLAHFQMGTIGVQEGDEVSTGTVLGLAGNSGNSFGPHVHIHLQDEADFHSRTARGLPLPFTGYFENGELHESGSPIRGDLVQHRGS